MLPFWLSRWYGDCVSDSGEAFVVSAADLNWGPARFRYQTCAHAGRCDWPVRRHSTLTAVTFPGPQQGRFTWSSEKLGFHIEWEPLAQPVERRLFASKAGSVHLKAVIPWGAAQATLPLRGTIRGFGYLERVDLSVPPWDLPITRLRRGRFLSSGGWALWLDWEGPHSLRAAILNGAEVLLGDVTSARIALGPAVIEAGDCRTLRDSSLSEGSIGAISSIEPLIPPAALKIHEHTRLCPAVLRQPGEGVLSGWLVDQLLRWPDTA